jgi:ABC-type Na+ efflux pump permease subunit
VLVLIPFGCYRSLLAEREQTTFELLSITSLSPRQVIWGKLLSAGLQMFIFYSAIAPFVAAAGV